ncbi:MAG TPA: class I SAM-dependent methyltransferase [Candidatus Stackebrandtia faecavium]|nr:class I SAM-dependent methyltransferase [Candidatus Stackebrandtia faecavium]
MTVLTCRVRDAYGSRADEYAAVLGSVDVMARQDRDTIADWISTVYGPVVDAGCGPGHWTKFLHDEGVAVSGVDLVPEFVHVARARFPEVTFHVADMNELPAETSSLGGLLSWYSLIHTAPDEVPSVLREFKRCLRPDGTLLLGFFDGDRVAAFDHAVTTAYFWPVPDLCRALEGTGFRIVRTYRRTDPGSRPHAAIVAAAGHGSSRPARDRR